LCKFFDKKIFQHFKKFSKTKCYSVHYLHLIILKMLKSFPKQKFTFPFSNKKITVALAYMHFFLYLFTIFLGL